MTHYPDEQAIIDSSILVVDDNAANVDLVTEMLAHHGFHRVIGETDPRKVAELCSWHRFDMILLDVRMPHIDGLELMAALQELFAGEFIPILVLTAQTDRKTRQRALETGAADFLTKPFITWELIQRVRNMLRTRVLYRQISTQNQDLERRVRERTEALSEALAASRRADQAKLDFLAVMSHELRTPLNAIIGFAEVLRSEHLAPLGHPDYVEYVSLIEDSGRELLSMVNRILDFTRGTTGTIALQEAGVELRALLRFCIAIAMPKAIEKQVTVTLADGAGIAVTVDERRMREVFLSLLDNAVKFNHPGGRVQVDVERLPNGVGITFADNGPGIDPDLQDRLFDPFSQADASLGRKHAGIGLGLPMVRRMIELHGGRIDITSKRGNGTTVSLYLPAARIITAAAEDSTPASQFRL